MIDVEKTIISQYANSSIIIKLINNFNEYIDQTANINNFLSYVWDVSTAQGFGLDIWGRIVGVSRYVNIPTTEFSLGFDESGNDWQPWGQAPFTAGDSTNTYSLSDEAYRTLILVKALSNISDSTIPALNQLLMNLFSGRGRCYVNDLGSMQIRYTFEFTLEDWEFAIMVNSGAVPRPSGVTGYVLSAPNEDTFGFYTDTLEYQPFGLGVFLPQGALSAIK